MLIRYLKNACPSSNSSDISGHLSCFFEFCGAHMALLYIVIVMN